MPSSMTCITRELSAELRYQYYSGAMLVVAVLMAVGATVAFTGSASSAQSAHESFVERVEMFEENGVSLGAALEAPMTITRDGNAETIDNPLKYDYLEVGKSFHAIDGVIPLMGTALDLVTFIVIPLTFLALGANSATFDRRARTMKLRASRDAWPCITAAKLLSIALMAALAITSTTLSATAISIVVDDYVRQLTGAIDYELSAPTPASPLIAKLLMTLLVAVFFGFAGYAVGAVTNSTSWPMVLAAAALFVLPFVSPWDPRNLLATLGVEVYDFWGQFRMRPPLVVELPAAVAALVGYLTAAVAVSMVLPRAGKRFR